MRIPVIFSVFIAVSFAAPAKPTLYDTGDRCITSCEGRPDGDYQSCVSCTVYISCSNGLIHEGRPCPAGLVWDDNVKRCEYTSTTCNAGSGDGTCVDDCTGMDDGDYQSCQGCTVFATCSNEILYDNRPCPIDQSGQYLVWDDGEKRCLYSSSTCSESSDAEPESDQTEPESNQVEEDSNKPVKPDVGEIDTGESCISSCEGKADGDYQSCVSCTVYITCANELIYAGRPCPAGLVWDDNVKRCEYFSTTCYQGSGNGTCVDNCLGVDDGDYQSCEGCTVFATCANNILYDNRPCPIDQEGNQLYWDDAAKRCLYSSRTCVETNETSEAEQKLDDTIKQDDITEKDTGDRCISSCDGLNNGDYQSCLGCDVYASCSNGDLYDNRPCPSGLVWDDNVKRCEETSTTCNSGDASGDCVSDCSGLADGDYQSCLRCSGFVSCSNELLYEMPCPSGLVWDDNVKRCERTSSTCSETLSSVKITRTVRPVKSHQKAKPEKSITAIKGRKHVQSIRHTI